MLILPEVEYNTIREIKTTNHPKHSEVPPAFDGIRQSPSVALNGIVLIKRICVLIFLYVFLTLLMRAETEE